MIMMMIIITIIIIIIIIKFRPLTIFPGTTEQLSKHAVAQLDEALRYKPEG
jgi:hypothetical protein